MKIKEINKIEDCFDGSSVFGYIFDEEWTKAQIHRLHSLGILEYFSDFPRPFFRVRSEGGAQIKGVEGEKNCRAIFPKRRKEDIKSAFEKMFQDDIITNNPSR